MTSGCSGTLSLAGLGFRVRKALVDVMRLLFYHGLVNVFGGNASAKLCTSFGFCAVYVTPSGKPKLALKPEDIVAVDPESGAVLGGGKPTVELPMHLTIYRVRCDARAVVHAHTLYALEAWRRGILDVSVLGLEANYYLNTCIASVPKLEPGSRELAKAVGEKIRECDVVMLEDHGIVAIGVKEDPVEAVYQAFDRILLVEEAAKIALAREKLDGPSRKQMTGFQLESTLSHKKA